MASKIYYLIISMLLCPSFFVAQVNKYYIGDTLNIDISNDYDSSIFLKKIIPNSINKVYYDTAFSNIAFFVKYNNDKQRIDTVYSWYRNGSPKSKYIQFGDNIMNASTGYTYNMNGTLTKQSYHLNDTSFFVTYYSNKQIKLYEKYYYNDPYYAYSISYCENGNIKSSSIMSLDTIQSGIVYYCNGKICRDCLWYKGRILGYYKEYFENGRLKVVGNYENLSIEQLRQSNRNINKIGIWKYYNENGKLTKKEKYPS